jgi:hypothetical protein
MIKLVSLLKRRPGMSKADFTAYYENHHRVIGERVLAGYATRYFRRHVYPVDSEFQHCDPDVVMEIWFPDQERMDAFFASIANDPVIAAEIGEDEERLFDRSRLRSFVVEEFESELKNPLP